MKNILLVLSIIFLCMLSIQNSFALPKDIIDRQKNNDQSVTQFLEYYDNHQYDLAYDILKNNNALTSYSALDEKIDTTLQKYKEKIMILAHAYEKNGEYDKAIEVLENNIEFYQNDSVYTSLLGHYKTIQSDSQLVQYNGPMYSVTIRPLLAFPEYALTSKNPNYNDLDKYYLTPSEYKNILLKLYENDFVLIRTSDAQNTNLKLPEDKKPILMCYENVCYSNDYKCQIDRLILNRDDKIATYTGKKSIRDRISLDNEFVPILEDFLLTHPDFSFKNARGVIYLSGSKGILGYKTQKTNANYKYEVKQVSKLVSRLKSLGWEFGSNGYSYQDMNLATNIEFTKNIFNFSNEVENIVGKVSSYLCPNGEYDTKSDNFDIIQDNYPLCIVYDDQMGFDENGLLHSIYLGGESLRKNESITTYLFDSESVYDSANRSIPFK